MPITLSLSGLQHDQLRSLLLPGDGKEAVALLLCGRRDGDRRHRLLVREVHGIPYDICTVRTPDRVTWPPDYTAHILERAADLGLSVIKVHSHPGGYPTFSPTDDKGDARLLPMIRGWIEKPIPHGSAVMLPDGSMFGRVMLPDGSMKPLSCISVAGDDLMFWHERAAAKDVPGFAASHAQAFDQGTVDRLQRLSTAVVGASGTGSPVIEQLVRLGIGEIVIVEDDHIEDRNVNRILNSIMEDAVNRRSKAEVQAAAIERMGLGTRVITIDENLWNADVIRKVAQCDVVFGCMDTVDGRFLLNSLATYYTLPYFDLGVRLDADGKGGIREVCGTIHYLQPGRSSLMSRGLFAMEDVAAAGLRRTDPEAYRRQVEDGYIRGAAGSRPAVISVNMLAASLAVNEFLARLHPYREEPNAEYASVIFSLASMELMPEPEEGICDILGGSVGKGDLTPLLGLMDFMERRPQ
ncbi:thiamine biosynthesis protein ThiF [Methylocella silvestris]|uniref:Thiamine biosynthesis protein ThiF n=1 Tax=Methylocella silvestris TaxID=199596 RepID=A0A2J7TCD0_METSI|nr:thiamine biosynthesis protein ThiF [Methylocella silvestris]